METDTALSPTRPRPPRSSPGLASPATPTGQQGHGGSKGLCAGPSSTPPPQNAGGASVMTASGHPDLCPQRAGPALPAELPPAPPSTAPGLSCRLLHPTSVTRLLELSELRFHSRAVASASHRGVFPNPGTWQVWLRVPAAPRCLTAATGHFYLGRGLESLELEKLWLFPRADNTLREVTGK